MKKMFNCEVGLSDHTMGVGASIAAVAHGATVIEKHFTLDRSDGGVDSVFSLEPHELELLVIETERAWRSLGFVSYGGIGSEEKSKIFRRSIYVANDIKAGDTFTEKNLRIVRPGMGLKPKYYEHFLGKKAVRDIKKGTAANWSMIYQ
jgi:N-acetylneuraminate synthase